jgi:hypothetical protein
MMCRGVVRRRRRERGRVGKSLSGWTRERQEGRKEGSREKMAESGMEMRAAGKSGRAKGKMREMWRGRKAKVQELARRVEEGVRGRRVRR